MKLLLNFSSTSSLLFLFVATAFADEGHPEGTAHTEGAVVIDPVFVIFLTIVLAIGGFILWKFVLSSPKSSSSTQSAQGEKAPIAQEKTVSQSGEGEIIQKSE